MNFRLLNFSLLLIALLTFFCGCKENPPQNPTEYSKDEFLEYSKLYNKELKKVEEEKIEKYVNQSSKKFKKTNDGFYMTPLTNGSSKLQDGDVVVINYSVKNLADSIIYNVQEIGEQKMVLGKAQIPIGMEYAIKKMKAGDQATLILPSSLAYGLEGDGNKIKADQVLIYDIYLSKILPQ